MARARPRPWVVPAHTGRQGSLVSGIIVWTVVDRGNFATDGVFPVNGYGGPNDGFRYALHQFSKR